MCSLNFHNLKSCLMKSTYPTTTKSYPSQQKYLFIDYCLSASKVQATGLLAQKLLVKSILLWISCRFCRAPPVLWIKNNFTRMRENL